MMGPRQVEEAALFYEFSLERHVPATHVLRSIDRFVDLSADFFNTIGATASFRLAGSVAMSGRHSDRVCW